MARGMTQVRSIYVIYDKEGLPAFVGYTEECMKYLEMTKASFYCAVCLQAKNPNKTFRNGYTVRYVDSEVVTRA